MPCKIGDLSPLPLPYVIPPPHLVRCSSEDRKIEILVFSRPYCCSGLGALRGVPPRWCGHPDGWPLQPSSGPYTGSVRSSPQWSNVSHQIP